jgi:hypothetical protein
MSDELPAGVTAEDVHGYKRIIARCWIVAGLLAELPLERLEQNAARAETLGPIVYPQIWRSNAKAIMEDREMLRALVTAQRDLMTTSPSLQQLAGVITAQVDGYRPFLDQTFRGLASRTEVAAIPPQVILTAFVRFIADRVPDVPSGQ